MVLTEKMLDEILNYLDNSVSNLVKDTISSPEFQMESGDLKQFLSNQYDIRLTNLLQGKNSNVHHLESGMKNKTIQRKEALLTGIIKQGRI
ncbi:MAG: hypothetical protein OEM79_00980 [Nitrosopumilus sp.]|nr:hypothetical protein [Nitrosopumilus sp.]